MRQGREVSYFSRGRRVPTAQTTHVSTNFFVTATKSKRPQQEQYWEKPVHQYLAYISKKVSIISLQIVVKCEFIMGKSVLSYLFLFSFIGRLIKLVFKYSSAFRVIYKHVQIYFWSNSLRSLVIFKPKSC